MSKKKIMVVDDAVFMRTLLKSILDRGGYEVVAEAGNGLEAVNTFKELHGTDKSVDLVLMDITMPEMSGTDALQAILKFDGQAKVVMCSSLTGQKQVVEAIQMGAKHFIGKPFVEDQVKEIIKKVIGN